jgi:hypothetical protein
LSIFFHSWPSRPGIGPVPCRSKDD